MACSSEPPATVGPTVKITLDGVALRELQLTGPTTLASIVPSLPPITWLEVTASANDGRFLEIQTPVITYPRAEVRLYLERGKPAIGIFRSVDPDLPAAVARIAAQPVGSLIGVLAVDIITTLPPASTGGVTLEVGGHELEIDPAKLGAVPNDAQRGWLLADVIATLANGAHPRKVRIIGPTDHVLDDTALRDPKHPATLKLTHQGAYVFRVWDNGKAIVDVRPVTSIVVE